MWPLSSRGGGGKALVATKKRALLFCGFLKLQTNNDQEDLQTEKHKKVINLTQF